MRGSKLFRLTLAVAVIAAPAWAVKPGETLYIRSNATKVLKTAAANAATVGTLKAGDEVIWNGPDAKDKTFHKVKPAKGKEGFVLQANLTPSKPLAEMSGDGKTIDARAVASSGAATRALSECGQNYANKKPELKVAGQQVVLLEGINAKVTEKEIAEHAIKAGLSKAGGK